MFRAARRCYIAGLGAVQDEALARALRILQETTGDTEGPSFVAGLARGLARAFEVPCALVCEVDPADPGLARPMAAWIDGVAVDFPPYPLRGTPCARVVAGEICVYPAGVCALFPDDESLVALGVESYAGVVLRGRDSAVIGFIVVFDHVPRPDLAQYEPILATFAAQAGWSIERARFELHLRRNLERAQALTRIATGLHRAHAAPDEAFKAMCAEVRAVLDVTAVSVTLFDEHTGRLDRRAHVGLSPAWIEYHDEHPAPWIASALRSGRQVIRREDVLRQPEDSFYRRADVRGAVLAAIRHEVRLLGFITALQLGGERVLTSDDVAWLEAVAGLLVQVVVAGRLVEALRRSEQSYRRIVTTTNEGVWTVDAHQRTNFVNQRMAEMVGYSVEEMLGRRLHDFVMPEDHPLITSKFAERRKGLYDRYEHRYLCKDGSVVIAQVSTSPLHDESGAFIGALAMVRDVTELRQLEARMLHAQKLESLGVLAGGIAHDFNNLLVGILGNVGLARAELPRESPAQAYLGDVQMAATRASDLTAQMLAYAGKGRFVIQRLDLNRLIEEILHLLTAVISKKARLRTQFAADLPAIEGDATQIRQVVMNLITNASDALEDGHGDICVRTEAVEVDDATLAATYVDEGLTPGRYVALTVDDTGCGFDAATRARLFDPFFTTKFAGRGLGLAAVLGILRGHRGAISVDSTPGRGARFRVLLPAVASAAPTSPRGEPRSGVGPGLVLVADDETAVRTVARRVLERAGFTVVTAADGREALAVFTAGQDDIRAVLLDMTMPLMRGDEVCRELCRLRPDVRVVLTSGFSDPSLGPGLTGHISFLAKPWTPQQLLAAVREVLART